MTKLPGGAQLRRRIGAAIAPAVRLENLLQLLPLGGVCLVAERVAERVEIRAEVDRRQPVSGLFADDFIFVKEHVVAEVDSGDRSALQPLPFAPRFQVVGKIAAFSAEISE